MGDAMIAMNRDRRNNSDAPYRRVRLSATPEPPAEPAPETAWADDQIEEYLTLIDPAAQRNAATSCDDPRRILPTVLLGRAEQSLMHDIAEGLQSALNYVAAARTISPGPDDPSDNSGLLIRAATQIERARRAYVRLRDHFAADLKSRAQHLRGEDL